MDENANTMPQETPTPETPKKEGELNTTMAFIAYLLFFVPLLTDSKDDPFVKFHVKQAIVLVVASLAAVVLGVIPFLGLIISPLASIAVTILWIVGMINALTGKQKEVPFIGKFADQYLKF